MRFFLKSRFKRTTLIICGLLSFLIGLGLARLKLPFNASLLWLNLVIVVITFRSKNLITLITIIAFCLLAGLWRGTSYIHQLAKYQPVYRQKVVIIGRADTSGVYDKSSQLTFDLINLKIESPYHSQLIGKIGVKGFGTTAVFRGDQVQVSGKLYPTRGSRQASISYAQIKVLKRSTSIINLLRRKFEAGMLSALPEPLASFALGLLIGQRSTLPQAVNDQLSAVGLTHIVAVSGYNLTIIISAVYLLLKKLSKYQAFLGSVTLIILFIIFSGMSASIVRAAIVSLLGLAATYYGRSFKPLMLILLASVCTAGWSPMYLWSDIGWYLSFLAFYGILILAPLIIKRLFVEQKPKLIAVVIIESLAAQIMTIPIVMYIFGQVSLVSLPANILVVPLVPLAMLASFIVALAGMLTPAIAGWLAWPARILLTYMLDVVGLMSRIPHALTFRSLQLNQVIIMYTLIIIFCWLLWFKTKPKNGIITD